MIHAYDERYLGDAMKNLGEAADYAVCLCGIDLGEFLRMFVASGIADRFGNGVPKYVSGMSGTELAGEIFSSAGYKSVLPAPRDKYSLSPEYWCGWVLALYQWFSGNTFKRILEKIDGDTLLKMYPTLHEAPEQKCMETMNEIMKRGGNVSKLQLIRESRELTQKELSEKAGVNLRTLQQYEIRAKNINRAAASTLIALSKTLGCRIEDLLETEENPVEDLFTFAAEDFSISSLK